MAPRSLDSCYTIPADVTPLLGDWTMPRDQTMDSWVIRAADEMDGIIGQRYKLPLEIDDVIPDHRADYLLLKRINEFLAAGRLLLGAAGGGQEGSTNAYATYLVNEATKELARISAGRTLLEAGEELELAAPTVGVMALNRDESSFVDQFYSSFGTAHQPTDFWKRT